MDGFWTAKFGTPLGSGGGVVYFANGEIFGGDGGFTYIGTYVMNGSQVAAQLRISPHMSGIPNVFGNGQPFDLNIKGSMQGSSMSGVGEASHVPGVSFQVNLTRVR